MRSAPIGEPFNLSLPSRSQALVALPQPLPVQFTVLEEKFVGRTVYEGHLTALSDSEATIQSPLALTPLSNLKITVAASRRTIPRATSMARCSRRSRILPATPASGLPR
jgi:hypothetical protein